jgi:hypothetical protein
MLSHLVSVLTYCACSVMLSSMATSFGISTELLDAELSRFIAAGRLNAKIDKVHTTSAHAVYALYDCRCNGNSAVFRASVKRMRPAYVANLFVVMITSRPASLGFRGTGVVC